MNWNRGKTLGKGSFGTVSIAKTRHTPGGPHTNLPPLIAVKSAPFLESDSLWKEKKLLQELEGCPFIVRCLGKDVTTEKGQTLYNLLLEYASGGSLADCIHSGLPEKIVSHCTRSILSALVHIHSLGYVHSDVKPQNVLVFGSNYEAVKLADFGCCKRWKLQEEEEEKCGFRGTLAYAAPESVHRHKYLPESDIWALGCTVVHMLTGRQPWLPEKEKDVMFEIDCRDEILEISHNIKVSRVAKDFLNKCLIKDPMVRWKADMLLNHPFLHKVDDHSPKGRHRLSHRIYSLVPHCFQVEACG
ncbi:mitogen-activated protein kinase kinase kinase 19 [Striga asiatica]|uniref:Mitogen-activated protein kinase kinase kinase 19 n=1 Tax=Striga asiatica TaxID=4170 RepID=A0A5A7Q8U8_STRAF|nr:mitogen-activated protein kinase kinase kinase 19 [Striga asiatica]